VQSKYESFTRQLNGWGFKRLHQSGNDFNAYYHECFLRGLPHLIMSMKCATPNQGKLLPHVEGEPNFYQIDKLFPIPPCPHTMMMQPQAWQSSHPMGASPREGEMPAGYPPREGEVGEIGRTTTKMPAGYQDQYHHPSYPPGSYPPQHPYYGHQGNPHAGGAAYASQPPSYPHKYPNQYDHPHPHEHYPHYAYPPPGPQYGAPPHYGMPQQHKAANPVMDGDGAAPPADAQGADQGDKTPAGEEGAKDDSKTHPNQYNHSPPYRHYPYYPYPPPPPGSHYGAIPPHYGMKRLLLPIQLQLKKERTLQRTRK